MSMAALLLTTLYAAMYVATRAKRVATLAVEPARSASIAAEMMTQDLQGVLPPNGNFRGAFKGTHQPAGAGSADMMEFYCIGQDETQGPESPFSEGIRKVDLILRTDVQPPVLVRQVTRNLLAPTAPVPQEEVICRNVRSFSVQYFDGFSWLPDWDSTTTGDVLPTAISLRLEMEDPTATTADARPLIISRVVPLACARPLDEPIIGGGTAQ